MPSAEPSNPGDVVAPAPRMALVPKRRNTVGSLLLSEPDAAAVGSTCSVRKPGPTRAPRDRQRHDSELAQAGLALDVAKIDAALQIGPHWIAHLLHLFGNLLRE